MIDTADFVPVLSEGIEFNPLSEKEYILSNAQHRHYVKINTDVYHLLHLIDGKRNLDEISELYREQFRKKLSASAIYELLSRKLVPFGILKGFDEQIKGYEKPAYLKLSFTIINEKVLSKIVPCFFFFFKKRNAMFILPISLLFIALVFYFKLDLYQSFNIQRYFYYYILAMVVSVTFHEIGHAAAATYFGAKPGGIGGGFYLFRPVYYADVTDIWRLKRNQRIIVNLSGIYFELIFCSILLLISVLSGNYTLLVITLLISITTLFNLIPFIRSDGFWVLSDLISKPNLLQHARKKIVDVLKYLFLRKPVKWQKYDAILAIYGVVSYAFMGLFLYTVLIKNPASIIYFPKSVIEFAKGLIEGADFSVEKLFGLLLPLFFYILLFRLLKSLLVRRFGSAH
jgi:putative peptide zinc metalloprotease protein